MLFFVFSVLTVGEEKAVVWHTKNKNMYVGILYAVILVFAGKTNKLLQVQKQYTVCLCVLR